VEVYICIHRLADGDGKAQNVPSEDKELFLRSQHSSMINGLHGRYQVYGPVVR
jgi:U3 small nucleolar RNA-associated protein 22